MKTRAFLKALLVVTLFWWLVLLGFGILNTPQGDLAQQSTHHWFASSVLESLELIALELFMACFCVFLALQSKIKERNAQLLSLREDLWFGLRSSLGSVQCAILSPRFQLHPTKIEQDHLIRNLSHEFSPLILKFMDQTQKRNPLIANAMRHCLALLCLDPHFPASSQLKGSNVDDPDLEMPETPEISLQDNHHGQCTLLEHSLRVAAFVILERERFKYQGLQTDLRTLIAPKDDFQLDPQDPFPVLLGLVHDIGKLQTFQLNERHQVTHVKGHHGPVGALLLAQLDCIKTLSAHHQHALSKALYHYHNAYHFTVKDLKRFQSDYVVANMMLLIKADKKASLAERLGQVSKSDAAFFEYFMSQ